MAKKLSLEETKKLLKSWRLHGNKKAYETLFKCNKPLVISMANRFYKDELSYEDIMSAASEGLVKAINRFDLSCSITTFPSYIESSIKRSIKKEIKNYYKHSHVLSFDQSLCGKKDGVNDKKVEEEIGTEPDYLINEVSNNIKKDMLMSALNLLTLRQKQIIMYKYFNDLTQEQIAYIFSCSKTVIKKEEKKALVRLRTLNSKKFEDFIN